MSDKRLRAGLEKRIRQSLPDVVWEHVRLMAGESVCAVDQDTAVRDLFDAYKSLISMAHLLVDGGARTRTAVDRRKAAALGLEINQLITSESLPDEARRAAVASLRISKLAELHPSVLNLRNDLLSGTLLDAEEVYRLIASPAAAFLSPLEFVEYGIQIARHDSLVVSTGIMSSRDLLCLRVELVIEPGNQTLHLDSPVYRLSHGWLQSVTDVEMQEMAPDTPVPRAMLVWPNSVIDRLNGVSGLLIEAFGFDDMEAKQYLLAGEQADLRPVVAQYSLSCWGDHVHPRIAMSIEPWATAETVQRNYLMVQRRVLARRNRRLGSRQLALYEFVFEHETELSRRGKWECVRSAWNRYCEEIGKMGWAYEDVRQLTRDYHRTKAALFGT